MICVCPKQPKFRMSWLSSCNEIEYSLQFSIPEPRISVNAKYPLEATKALRTVSRKAGLEAPDQIRSTLLRKHIAMMSQLVNLSSAEMHQLVNFMGHNLNIHMDYYRLPDDIEQITKVGRLLVAVEDGRFKRG